MYRILQIFVLVATFVAAAWVAIVVPQEPTDRVTLDLVRQLDAQFIDEPAIEFQLSDLNGNPHSLSEFRGQVVFLNFWATWCPPCVEETPSLVALSQTLADRPFKIIAVTHDEDPDALIQFVREQQMDTSNILILRDPTGDLAERYGTALLPETYVIDPTGQILARFVGAEDWSDPNVLRLVERLIRFPWKFQS